MSRPVVIVSSDVEWKVLRDLIVTETIAMTPFGESFVSTVAGKEVLFFQGGWGKISASASTQYIIDHFQPQFLINIGTCGSFDPAWRQGDILCATRTIVYDIYEQMGDADEAIAAYTVDIDTAWAEKLSTAVRSSVLISGDRDVIQQDINDLRNKYGAVAADWESGAIAWTAKRNNVPVLILRGVSDVVGNEEAAAYNNLAHFADGTLLVMKQLLKLLPLCLKSE